MTYGELQSCPTCNSLTICLRTFSFASNRMICPSQHQRGICVGLIEDRTFLAMTTLVDACETLLTVPPLPAPSSLSKTKSSLRKSSLNSRPISRVSVLLLSEFPIPPGICASPSEGLGALAGALFNVRFLAFLRLKEFGLKGSDIFAIHEICPYAVQAHKESCLGSDTVDCTPLRLPSSCNGVRGYQVAVAAMEAWRYQKEAGAMGIYQ